MNKYKFSLGICGGYRCGGSITVEAQNEEEATDKAQTSFVERWCEAFPELEVDYDVNIIFVEIDQEEIKRKIKKAFELCPGDEKIEISYDGYEVRVLRYSESRGSAESIDGMEDDDVLWNEDDAGYDDNFDRDELLKDYDVYLSGF